MNDRILIAAAVALMCTGAQTQASGLKDFLKGVKDKAVETVQQQVPNKAEQPAAEEVVSAEAAQAVEAVKQAQPAQPVQQQAAPVATSKSSSGKAPAPSSKPAAEAPVPADTGLWPNLAVDPAIVKQQQKAYGDDCRQRLGDRPDINCQCFEDKYPQERLLILSEDLRKIDDYQKTVCKDGLEGCDEPGRFLFLWLSEAKTQKNYPTSEGKPNIRGGGGIHNTESLLWLRITQKYDTQCRNYDYIANQGEQRCLANVKSNLISLKPGTSTKAYCGCVKQKLLEQEGESQAMIACQS